MPMARDTAADAKSICILGSRPTQLWTGGGHHYIQPQSAIVLEKSKTSRSSTNLQEN